MSVPLCADSVPLPTQLAGVSATVNGVRAPLYYVSPGLLNIQIPYEATPNNTAVLTVNNNGLTGSLALFLGAAAPGIFSDPFVTLVPTSSAARGQTVALYLTGAGAVTPAVATGAAPDAGTLLANLPQPLQTTKVTVAGIPAPIQFMGIPSGLVGVVQINFQVPDTVPLGAQALVVTVGSTSSAPVTLNVTDH